MASKQGQTDADRGQESRFMFFAGQEQDGQDQGSGDKRLDEDALHLRRAGAQCRRYRQRAW